MAVSLKKLILTNESHLEGAKDYSKTWVAEFGNHAWCKICQAEIEEGDLAILSIPGMEISCQDCKEKFIKTGDISEETIFRTVMVEYPKIKEGENGSQIS